MADTLDKFTRILKRLYEETGNMLLGGKKGIDQFLFDIDDMDESANFALDQLIVNPEAVTFRQKDEQSHIREYKAGSGTIYEVPHASEKTPISEALRDAVVAGIESTGSFSTKHAKMVQNIINQHVAAHTITRWKTAIDTIRTGIFTPLGIGGKSIGLEINFNRDASLSITYDFTAVGADINEALYELITAYRAQGGSYDNMCIIMGRKWLKEFSTDTTVIEYMKANAANQIVMQSIMPPELFNTQGLMMMARYLVPGEVAPVYICAFEPRYKYVAYVGATAADFMPEDEAIIFSIGDDRYRVFRGVDALGGNEKAVRTVGEIVFDSFNTKDPVTELIRSQTRFAMVPGNVNRTARSAGTFPES
jgi:hypothetical protein